MRNLGLSRLDDPPTALAYQLINDAPRSTPLLTERGWRDPCYECVVLLQFKDPDRIRNGEGTVRGAEHVTLCLPRIVGELLRQAFAKTLSIVSVHRLAGDSIGAPT